LEFKRAILTHGGAGSSSKDFDGPKSAALLGLDLLKTSNDSLEAVVSAVKFLENDPRFNAGLGSQLRADGKTIQLDASCMNSQELFGAVACVEGYQNPIEIANKIARHSPHLLLIGDGIPNFIKAHNMDLKPLPTLKTQPTSKSSCDTVGAVAFDGETFSAGLSSGGLKGASIGRVGDVPLLGCGLFCGSMGAVACTGDGEDIALKVLAKTVYGWLENKMPPSEAATKALSLFAQSVDVGLIILTKNDFAAISRNDMAWGYAKEENS